MKIVCDCGHEFEISEKDIHSHRILCGDATKEADILKLMDGKKADLIFTDPPYGTIDGRGKVWKGGKKFNPGKWDEILLLNWINIAFQHIRQGCWYIIFTDHLSVKEVWEETEINGGHSKAVLCYYKNNFAPTPRSQFANNWEAAIAGTLGSVKQWFGGSHTPTAITVDKIIATQKSIHPTQKPIELCCKLITPTSDNNQIVVDFFLGSGSTLIACIQINRILYGTELEPKYIDVILDRYAKFTGDDPIRESDGVKWSELKKASAE